MIYTHKLNKAIHFSIQTHEVHQKQKRKGKDIAYITHPLTVGIILSRAGAPEDVVIAGILHDTIEDSTAEAKVTKEMLTEEFGEVVAELVASVSETRKELTWEERKADALEHIRHFSKESVLLKSGDIVANTSELLDDYAKINDEVFARFNAPEDKKENVLRHYLQAITLLLKQYPDSPLADDLRHLSSRLFDLNGLAFMRGQPAPIVAYRDYKETDQLECPVCLWTGTGAKASRENGNATLDISCPNCSKMILVAEFATA